MRASRISVSIISIAIVVALVFLLFSDRQPSYIDKASDLEPANTNLVELSEVQQAGEKLSGMQFIENYPVDECITLEAYFQSPQAYQIDEWLKSWGAPPSFNTALSGRTYAHYRFKDLLMLLETGDAEAMHEIGRDLIWSALHDGQGMPDYKTLWDVGDNEYPYSRDIDLEKLERGRKHLYDAAVAGHVYALVEISLSFSHQRRAARQYGQNTREREEGLQIEAFAYGEATEELIVGLHSSFFQASIPGDAKSEAIRRTENLVGEIHRDREIRGLDVTDLPSVSDEILDPLNLCKE